MGDAGLFLELDYPDTENICLEQPFRTPEIKGLVDQAHAGWKASIENTLINNEVTLANFPMCEIVHPEGLLTQLRQQNYMIVTG